MTALTLPDDFFRREYSKQVAILARRFGVQHLQDIEDAVQAALMSAWERWPDDGVPEQPAAWLCRVAQNQFIAGRRQQKRRQEILVDQGEANPTPSETIDATILDDNEIADDQLRMMFVCCDEAIPIESQLSLALKILCGLNVREIALRLFTSEENIYKRLTRARNRLRNESFTVDDLTAEQYVARRTAVHKVIYLLFTEGHLSSNADVAIRRELCSEAIRLCEQLASHPVGDCPSTAALLALMFLHTARSNAREEVSGGLLLLEEQDRTQWDQQQIKMGLNWLAKSAAGDEFTRYHAEAGIAAEHCLAPSFAETRWDRIVSCYELLGRLVDSPLHQLNQAVAIAEWKGPQAALASLEATQPPTWLAGSYLWSAVLADLNRRAGNEEQFRRHRESAVSLAPTTAVQQLVQRRLGIG